MLCLSPSEKLSAEELVPAWTPGWIIHNICRAGGDSSDFSYNMWCVCVYKMSTVSIRNHPEIFLLSHRLVKLLRISENLSRTRTDSDRWVGTKQSRGMLAVASADDCCLTFQGCILASHPKATRFSFFKFNWVDQHRNFDLSSVMCHRGYWTF